MCCNREGRNRQVALPRFYVYDIRQKRSGVNLKAWPSPCPPRSANSRSTFAPSVPACTGCRLPPARMMPKASLFYWYPAGASKTGWPGTHSSRMPAILEGRRIPGYARPGGGTQEGSMGMDERQRHERTAPGGECVPEGCDTVFDGRGTSPVPPVFQDRRFQAAIMPQGESHAYLLCHSGTARQALSQ